LSALVARNHLNPAPIFLARSEPKAVGRTAGA